MTPAPQEYIITEEQLEGIIKLRNAYPGRAKQWDDMMDEVRSRPYTSASSDVLDEKIVLLKLVEDEIFKCIRLRGMEIIAVNSLFARHIRELRSHQTKEHP
jgi:hypothetical protein